MRGPVLIGVALSAAMLCACSPLPQLRGDFAKVDSIAASTGKFDGTTVRWGGVVTGTRLTDAGSCIEVAAYMLDRWSFRPTGLSADAYQRKPEIQPSYYQGSRRYARPRFLACGDAVLDGSSYYPGAVVTLTGSIEQPFVFEAEYDSCQANQHDRVQANYTGTVHAIDERHCAVSLPVLKITHAYAWVEPPRDGRLNWANGR